MEQQKTTAKSVGFFLYTTFTGIHKGSVGDPDPDSALYLIGSGFRIQGDKAMRNCGSMLIWIRHHPDPVYKLSYTVIRFVSTTNDKFGIGYSKFSTIVETKRIKVNFIREIHVSGLQ